MKKCDSNLHMSNKLLHVLSRLQAVAFLHTYMSVQDVAQNKEKVLNLKGTLQGCRYNVFLKGRH